MITVQFDTTPLGNAHALRGIGVYTRMLSAALQQNQHVMVVDPHAILPHPPADVLHYPFFDLFQTTLPLRRRTPIVVTIHDVIPLIFPAHYKPGVKGLLRFWRQRAALQLVDAVITDSLASKRDITRHLGVPASKVFVTYLAASPALQPATVASMKQVRATYALPNQYILYVGDINYNKNLPQLIKALKYLPPEVHLVCVGKNFVPSTIPEWKAIDQQLLLSDVSSRVHFVTNIPANGSGDLAAIYSAAVAYVQPSLYEGFGLPILEAMQCQTPVVATRTSSIFEVAGPAAELVAPIAEELAEGVKEVLGWSTAQRRRRVVLATSWAEQFTWQKAAQDTVAVYERIQKRHAS